MFAKLFMKEMVLGGVGSLMLLGLVSMGVACDGRSSGPPVVTADVTETKKRGEALVGIIEEFRKAKGRYPAALDELTPELKARVQEPTVWDKKWVYRQGGDGGFMVKVSNGPKAYPVMAYNSDSKEWSEDGVKVK